jgi:hypothetical protein
VKKARFSVELIEGHKGVIAAIVPFDPAQLWDAKPVALDARREGLLVTGTLNRKKFDGWIGHRWGKHFIIVDEPGLAAGDTVTFAIEPTTRPQALARALAQAPRTTAPKRKPRRASR